MFPKQHLPLANARLSEALQIGIDRTFTNIINVVGQIDEYTQFSVEHPADHIPPDPYPSDDFRQGYYQSSEREGPQIDYSSATLTTPVTAESSDSTLSRPPTLQSRRATSIPRTSGAAKFTGQELSRFLAKAGLDNRLYPSTLAYPRLMEVPKNRIRNRTKPSRNVRKSQRRSGTCVRCRLSRAKVSIHYDYLLNTYTYILLSVSPVLVTQHRVPSAAIRTTALLHYHASLLRCQKFLSLVPQIFRHG